jgi:hypothetical protein
VLVARVRTVDGMHHRGALWRRAALKEAQRLKALS